MLVNVWCCRDMYDLVISLKGEEGFQGYFVVYLKLYIYCDGSEYYSFVFVYV